MSRDSLKWLLLGVLGAATPLRGDEPTEAQLNFFEKSVRPVLVEHCQKCHGDTKQWAALRVDSRDALLKGGENGPAVVAGKPEESLLIRVIVQADGDVQMPPDGKLTDRQIADLTEWVRQGAHFPAGAPAGKDPIKGDNHWAFQPPREPAAPETKTADWSRNGIDHFILAKIEQAGLQPAADADRRTLIRRVTFDLTGLPPTPEEVAAFVADDRPEAYAELVERLLASPAYGERWGRHWLDVARYADSNGLDENVAHGNAWRYRDYVVDAFNKDMPFNQFAVEQLAGDLLPAADEATRRRQLVATGFLSLGPKVLAEVDLSKMQLDLVDEQVDTMGKAFLGLTIGCARCHDHKFDPISTVDYYGLAGIFKSTRTMDTYTKVALWHENTLPSDETRALQAAYDTQLAGKKSELMDARGKAEEAARASLMADATAPENLETLFPEETKAKLKALQEAVTALEKSPPELPSAMGVVEDKIVDLPVHIRGSYLKLGDVAPRHVPAVLNGPATPQFPAEQSGRLELARWLVDPQHPLTARVAVNRVWRWHFGKGLVRTPDSFGVLGDKPSHPELLDWLALRFMESNWSVKSLHRLIVLSRTYQQSSVAAAQTLEADPENVLQARWDVRRLEAEAVRDSLLAVSGQLDRTQGGPVLTVKNRGYLFDHTSKDLTTYESVRRSLYLPIIRNNLYDVLQLLDYPDASVTSGNRSSSTIAPQALLMLNSELVLQAADKFAARLLADATLADDVSRLRSMYRLAYGREAAPAELDESAAFLAVLEQALPPETGDAAARKAAAWSGLCQATLAANEFIYVR